MRSSLMESCPDEQGPAKCYRKYEPPTGKGDGGGCGVAPGGFTPVESSKEDSREVVSAL